MTYSFQDNGGVALKTPFNKISRGRVTSPLVRSCSRDPIPNLKGESEYLASIEAYERNLELTTKRFHIVALRRVEVPNRTIIKPTMDSLRKTYDECVELGYKEAAERAEKAMEKEPKRTLKEWLTLDF